MPYTSRRVRLGRVGTKEREDSRRETLGRKEREREGGERKRRERESDGGGDHEPRTADERPHE